MKQPKNRAMETIFSANRRRFQYSVTYWVKVNREVREVSVFPAQARTLIAGRQFGFVLLTKFRFVFGQKFRKLAMSRLNF